VLLVDDNFDMREYVARLLSTKYEVVSAANGTPPPLEVMHCDHCQRANNPVRIRAGLEALSVLRSGPNAIDLVLTDVMMPFLDGFGLLKELRYDTHHRTRTRTRTRH
jgi:CheY-like chemotaxis protein